MIEGLDHVQLAMPPGGEGKARWFFSDLLEMKEEEKPEPLASRGGCWFRSGNVILHVGVEKEFSPQKKAHPAFSVRDLDELTAVLKANAFAVTPDHSIPGRRRVYAADPFGNRIEFIQSGDGFSQR